VLAEPVAQYLEQGQSFSPNLHLYSIELEGDPFG
jgi:hypothetical protein